MQGLRLTFVAKQQYFDTCTLKWKRKRKMPNTKIEELGYAKAYIQVVEYAALGSCAHSTPIH